MSMCNRYFEGKFYGGMFINRVATPAERVAINQCLADHAGIAA